MEITLGQQYNVGEKPTVILYIYINRHAGTPEKTVKTNNKKCSSTPSHMVVVIYYKGSGRGGLGAPVLRGECEEVFVFELSGTHELYTINNTTYQVATT